MENHICNICGKKYLYRQSLQKHFLQHHKQKINEEIVEDNIEKIVKNNNVKFQCKYCNKYFTRKHYLNKHMETKYKKKQELPQGKFMCGYCNKYFNRKNYLFNHLEKKCEATQNLRNELYSVKAELELFKKQNGKNNIIIFEDKKTKDLFTVDFFTLNNIAKNINFDENLEK